MKPKLMTTSALPPSGEDCTELELFDQEGSKKPRASTAPGPHRDDGPLADMPVYLRAPDLRRLGIPWTPPYIQELEAAGKFPKRVRLGDNTVVWIKSEILAWQEQRNTVRGAPKAPPPVPAAEKKPTKKGKPAAKLPAKDRGGRKVGETSDALAAG
jgi:prophage regulatory protein